MQSRELVKLYYRIGEVSEIVGVQPHVLRYWETEFRSIRPQKSSKGQRVYSRRDVEKLLRVKDLLRNQGFTIAGARKRLSDAPDAVQPPLVSPAASSPVAPMASVLSAVSLAPVALAPLAAPASTAPSPAGGSVVVSALPAVIAAESAPEQISERGLREHRMSDRGMSDRSAKDMRKALLGLRHELMRMLDQISAPARDSQ